MSIVKMINGKFHPDMKPDAYHKKDPFYEPPCGKGNLHRYPHINLLLIMRDDWEVLE
jgi:hypothetical protein